VGENIEILLLFSRREIHNHVFFIKRSKCKNLRGGHVCPYVCGQVQSSKSLDRFCLKILLSQKAVVQFLPSSDVIRMSPLYLIPLKDVPLYIIVVYKGE